MYIQINPTHFVIFGAVESMRGDFEAKAFVVRTVSGVEHKIESDKLSKLAELGQDSFDRAILALFNEIVSRMAVCDS